MSNLKTLKPFKAGYDPRRNAKGRPEGSKNLSGILLNYLEQKAYEGKGIETYADVFIQSIIEKALKGNTRMIKLIFERVDGKPLVGLNMDEYIPKESSEIDIISLIKNSLK